jgi:hypothetical protein
MAELETRTLHRALAAFPDALTAGYLIYTWWLPEHVGREGIFASLTLIAMEMPALMAMASLFMLHTATRFIDRIKALFALGASIVGILLLSAGSYAIMPSVGLVTAVLAMLWGKWLIFAVTRKHSTWGFESMKLFGHFLVLSLAVLLCRDMEIPRGGFTDEVLQTLHLPGGVFEDASARNSPWRHPWWCLVAGAAYFSLCSVSRYYLSVRETDMADRRLLSKSA